MDDVVNIEDLRAQFVEKAKAKELTAFASKQQILIEKLLIENNKLKASLTHLETTVKQVGGDKVIATDMSAEELICIEQINILRTRSSQRELNLDEIKRLDILIKNLRLIREKSTEVIDTKRYRDVSEVDLVAIATREEAE